MSHGQEGCNCIDYGLKAITFCLITNLIHLTPIALFYQSTCYVFPWEVRHKDCPSCPSLYVCDGSCFAAVSDREWFCMHEWWRMTLLAVSICTGEHWGIASRSTWQPVSVEKKHTMHTAAPKFALLNNAAITREPETVLVLTFECLGLHGGNIFLNWL